MSLLELSAVLFLGFLGAVAFGFWKAKDKPTNGCACSGLAGITALSSGLSLLDFQAQQGRGPGEAAIGIAVAVLIVSVVAALAGSLVRGGRFGLAWSVLIGFGLQFAFLSVVFRE